MDPLQAETDSSRRAAIGALSVITAFTVWGILPLFFVLIAHVGAMEILAQRVLWALLAVVALKYALGQSRDLYALLSHRKTAITFAVSALLIGANWLIFVYGMKTGQVLQSSLGYFICPLLNVLLGVAFFGERLRPARALAVGLAFAAVALLVVLHGSIPYIALSLAGTFALYGLIRKQTAVDPITALFGDTIFLLPLALPYLGYLAYTGNSAFIAGGLVDKGYLMALAPITIIPLGLFAVGAKRLDLATLGFAQYIAPSLQFIIAVFILSEPFSTVQFMAFSLIWLALALYSADALAVRRKVQVHTAPDTDTDPPLPEVLLSQPCCPGGDPKLA